MLPRNRILLAYLLVLSLGAGLSVEIFWAGDRSQSLTEILFDEKLPYLRQIGEVHTSVLERELILYEYYATTDTQLAHDRLEENTLRFRKGFQPLQKDFANDPNIAIIEHHTKLLQQYTEQLDQVLAAQPTERASARELLGKISGARRAIEPALGKLTMELQQHAYITLEQSRRSSQITTALVAVYSIIIMLIAALVGYYINRYLAESGERKRLAMFAERNPDPVIGSDWQGNIHYTNPATARLLITCELDESNAAQLLPPNFPQLLRALYQSRRENAEQEYTVGSRIISCDLHLLEDLRVCHLHLRDITDKKIAEQRLHFLAYNDTLTSLPNRRSFDRDMQRLIADGKPLAVALISLDRFQLVTASNGYKVGDKLLIAAAARIQKALAHTALAGDVLLHRFDGSHFAAILRGTVGDDDLERVSKVLTANFAEPLEVDALCFYMSLSVGFSRFPDHGSDDNTLIKNADGALTRVMDQGGDGHFIYSEDISLKEQAWMALETELRHAVEHGELSLYYQPQVSTDGKRLVGMEALLRWHKANGQMVAPDTFIPVAEQTGLIVIMGEWVLRTACEQAQQWAQSGLQNFIVAVNISPRQFQHHAFLAMVAKVLKDTGVNPAMMELEITEGLIMHNVETSIDTLEKLKAMGLTLAIDDFGTGYSSLSYLKRFPIDKLKIDRSFVRNLEQDRDDLAIVCTIIDLAHHLGIKVIAEGVETEQQRQLLEQYKCEEMQGYFIARPAPPAQLADFIRGIQQRDARRLG